MPAASTRNAGGPIRGMIEVCEEALAALPVDVTIVGRRCRALAGALLVQRRHTQERPPPRLPDMRGSGNRLSAMGESGLQRRAALLECANKPYEIRGPTELLVRIGADCLCRARSVQHNLSQPLWQCEISRSPVSAERVHHGCRVGFFRHGESTRGAWERSLAVHLGGRRKPLLRMG